MTKSSPPPHLPKEKEDRGPFERWLYNFWISVTQSTGEGDQNILTSSVFGRNTAQARETMLGSDGQRILEGQIFGG